MSQAEQPGAGQVDGPPRTVRRSTLHSVPADLAVYAALAGREPRIDPSLLDPLVAATAAVREDPFSPGAVAVYLRELVRAKGSHVNRPELAAWLRRQSALARRRLGETRDRVSAAAFSVGAAREVDLED